MIKQMQRRFVRVAMWSVVAVLSLLLVGLNGLNYWQTVKELDGEAVQIMDHPEAATPDAPRPPQAAGVAWGDLWQQAQGHRYHNARYASATTDNQGQLVSAQLDHLDDLSQAQVATLLAPLADREAAFGWVGLYRYHQRTAEDGGRDWVLIDAGRQLQAVMRLAWISASVLVGSLLLVYGLLRYFSGRAIQPLLRNIERQREFISNASHEIKTPLAVLATNNEVLEMLGSTNEWTQSNRRQIQRLNRLVEQMLQLARYDEGQGQLNPQPYGIHQGLEALVATLQPLLARDQVALQWAVPESVVYTLDGPSFETICQVLLENALAYHLPGTPIIIAWQPDQACLSVRNACDPMTQAQAERLFERFYRPDQARQRDDGGSGVGLSLAQAVAEANGWQLQVRMLEDQLIAFELMLG